ncbi:MAG: hypothetical protein AB8B91_20635 [Rubripirellula sp.]
MSLDEPAAKRPSTKEKAIITACVLVAASTLVALVALRMSAISRTTAPTENNPRELPPGGDLNVFNKAEKWKKIDQEKSKITPMEAAIHQMKEASKKGPIRN